VTAVSTRLPVEPLTRGEADALVRACSLRSPSGVRNAALVTVLYRCGLRCQEALDLTLRDYDAGEGIIRVRHGKGDKSRTLGVPGDCAAMLALWLGRRQGLGVPAGSPVFCTLTGGPLDDGYVRKLFKRLGVRAGIEKRVHPHGLRHTFAHELDREGVPVTTIRDALGHSSVGVTDRYLRQVSALAVTETMRGR
jgi:integrase/recombinase XerD